MKMRAPLGIAALTTIALALGACSPAEEQPSDGTTGTATEAVAEDRIISLDEGVVRAKGTDNMMTAVFGDLVNHTDEEINVVGFDTDLETGSFELHEVVDGVMQEKEDGFTLAAGEAYVLEPGGDHLMIMGYPDPIEAGDTVAVTLLLEDGSEVELGDIQVRTMGAGDEDYGEDGELQGITGSEHMDGMDHMSHMDD